MYIDIMLYIIYLSIIISITVNLSNIQIKLNREEDFFMGPWQEWGSQEALCMFFKHVKLNKKTKWKKLSKFILESQQIAPEQVVRVFTHPILFDLLAIWCNCDPTCWIAANPVADCRRLSQESR